MGPSPSLASRPNHLTTATTGNKNGVSEDSDSIEGDYGDEQIDVDPDVYDEELE